MSLEVNPNLEAATNPNPSDDTGKVLLADASGKIPSGLKTDDKCDQLSPSTSSGTPSYTPNVWSAGEATAIGVAVGAPVLGAIAGPFSRWRQNKQIDRNASTVDSLSTDMIARREAYINYVNAQLKEYNLQDRITAARTNGSPLYTADNNGLLTRFASNDNLTATDYSVAQFAQSSREQLLSTSNLLPSFLTTGQRTEIGQIRDLTSVVRNNQEDADRFQTILNLTRDQIVDSGRALPGLTDSQRIIVHDMRQRALDADVNGQTLKEVQRFLDSTRDQILSPSFRMPADLLSTDQKTEIDQMRTNRTTLTAEEGEVRRIENRLGRSGLSGADRSTLEDELKQHQGVVDRTKQSLDTAEHKLRGEVEGVRDEYASQVKADKANTTIFEEQLRTSVTTSRDDAKRKVTDTNAEIDQRIQRLKTSVGDDHDKFVELRRKITDVDQYRVGELRALKTQLEDNKLTNPTKANDKLARLLQAAKPGEVTYTIPGRTSGATPSATADIKLSDAEFNTFDKAYTGSLGADARTVWQKIGTMPDTAPSTWSRMKWGAKVGGLGMLGLYGLDLAGHYAWDHTIGSPGSQAKTASECEGKKASDILGSGSLIPSSITGNGQPDYILGKKDQITYDFGSQALASIRQAEIDARSTSLTPDAKANLMQQVSTNKNAILEDKHNMKTIEQELAGSRYMIDPKMRSEIGTQLGAALDDAQRYDNSQIQAKAYRDAAVWQMAYIDAAKENKITGITPSEIDALKNMVKDNLNKAAQGDPQNKDLEQLLDMTAAFGIK